jgi:transketolase
MSTGVSDMKSEATSGSLMDDESKKNLGKVANTIRQLSIDGVQKANSGHPGLPLGCAEIGAYLYGSLLKHNPKNSKWINRDRFILSAGHGSMFLYSCLHLSGFDLSLEELKNFRQLHSLTPGHPEYRETDGVETTTGPLGQGIATAAGQALGLKLLAARFNTPEHTIIDSKVYTLVGDGCMMEGISSEASSLAGHLGLDNLVVIYDSNRISLDGPLQESMSEDVSARYRAYGWKVYEVDGHNLDELHQALSEARTQQTGPVLVVARTIIGKGSPNKGGTHKVHGAPLGPEEVAATKEALGLPQEDFYIPQAVQDFFVRKLERDSETEAAWRKRFDAWAAANPDLYQEFEWMANRRLPTDLQDQLKALEIKSPVGGRNASNACLQLLASVLPQLYGGSADLSCSDLTFLDGLGAVSPEDFSGRNIKYGVREFAMAAMASGLAQTDLITPFIGTFFTFSDYMRNAIRLAALMKVQVIYQFTHDSVFLGEDGPTHQPVEQLASLRAMPGLHVIRPGGNNEVKGAWLAALHYQGPTAIVLSRQGVTTYEGTDVPLSEGVGRGAYIIKKEKGTPDFTFFVTGSELPLAFDTATELEKHGKDVRIVSMPCWELFENQDDAYRQSVVGGDLGKRVAIEAGVDFGWHRYVGIDGVTITQDTFGASAPASELAKEFGFTPESILERIL